jgi:hypothetical protein
MAFGLDSTFARSASRLLTVKRATGAPAFIQNRRRLVSHYNVGIAGLTEEQAEVRGELWLVSWTLTLCP